MTDVIGNDAQSIQLTFDIEAWDAAGSRNNPGEAAFDVLFDLGTGNGFEQIMDLGTVTTGANLVPPADDFADGNSADYRVSFDAGIMPIHLPENSQFRVRWKANEEASKRGWVFGLDNVSLGMFNDVSVLGDFDQNGKLDVTDIDMLAAEIRGELNTAGFDLNEDGIVDSADFTFWVQELKQTWIGDANFDGEFNSGDLVEVFKAGQYEDGIAGNSSWGTGDWNGDGEFDTGDLVAAFKDGGFEAGARTGVNAVPEPTCGMIVAIGVLAICRLRQR
ncbi:MAG: hypothetical protein KDB27_14625 [Planctomycetales bacterium]|nr:hypothetical protein [Planctomycetales bacterium]